MAHFPGGTAAPAIATNRSVRLPQGHRSKPERETRPADVGSRLVPGPLLSLPIPCPLFHFSAPFLFSRPISGLLQKHLLNSACFGCMWTRARRASVAVVWGGCGRVMPNALCSRLWSRPTRRVSSHMHGTCLCTRPWELATFGLLSPATTSLRRCLPRAVRGPVPGASACAWVRRVCLCAYHVCLCFPRLHVVRGGNVPVG